jgi:hypothetical protein
MINAMGWNMNTWWSTAWLSCVVGAAQAANAPDAADAQGINALLSNYTQSVSQGDRARFESQLLDTHIPFYGVGGGRLNDVDLSTIQDYAGFRQAIFDGGVQFKQRFSNVSIAQVGNLAQVTLDYETAKRDDPYEGKGWKVMQLIKVGGQWKIASEFFTGYPRK